MSECQYISCCNDKSQRGIFREGRVDWMANHPPFREEKNKEIEKDCE